MDAPTHRAYAELTVAYNFLNEKLFENQLPPCLITMQRGRKAYGYFSGDRWVSSSDPGDLTNEIALNPVHFATRTPKQVFSTLAHEMVHLWQHCYGKPGRWGYHNKEWAKKMRQIGLIPSDTGQAGGKETGHKVTHYVEEGGAFERIYLHLEQAGATIPYLDRKNGATPSTEKKKIKYTCPICKINAWGKPTLKLTCGECSMPLVANL